MSAYLLYSLTLAFYKSYQIDIYITDFERENERIEKENAFLVDEFDYVTSSAYIDKILKQNKGLVNPGEDVIVIASNSGKPIGDGFDYDSFGERDYSTMSNMEKWQLFIFEENPFR